MRQDKWISCDKRTYKLVIRFHVKGISKQFFISTGLEDTNRNREKVRIRRDAIMNDIILDRFDQTLEKYHFKQKSTHPVVLSNQDEVNRFNLSQLWESFTNYQSAQIAKTTILGPYQDTKSLIYRLPFQELQDAAKIRDYLLQKYSHFMAWQSLRRFSQCCIWAVDSGLIKTNPFEKLQIQKPRYKNEDDFKAFTLIQRDLIISTFEKHYLQKWYASIIKFLFYTGCRPGEAFALTWDDISDDCLRINFSKSCNLGKVLKGTKNGKKRIFPCQAGGRLQNLLLNLRYESQADKGLIFRSKTACKLSTEILFYVWGSKEAGVVRSLTQQGALPYLRLYSTRHTFATWAIASGASPDKVAYWIGDDVRTVLKYYCHPNVSVTECPDF